MAPKAALLRFGAVPATKGRHAARRDCLPRFHAQTVENVVDMGDWRCVAVSIHNGEGRCPGERMVGRLTANREWTRHRGAQR